MKKYYRDARGFTLIEIMVVVVILGILASVVVPKLLNRPDQARITKAQLDIKGLEESMGMFKLDNGFYPTTEQGLGSLVSIPSVGRIPSKYPEGGYLKKVPQDPWEGQYLFLSPGLHSSDYDIISYGADGESGGEGVDADINSWDL
jgi:general secretion pathway protein G